ncbi:MAG: hypothetical protein RMM17_12460 [Acidobacteriota bacterium]|nr:hypothetical protein [Blastocatellia bacterium]MDW8413483.1 hypothetical protein [Acidobacteriota bacterium]
MNTDKLVKNTSNELSARRTRVQVEQVYLKDDAVELLEVTTVNTCYLFFRKSVTRSGLLLWEVLDGRQKIIGKTVGILSMGTDIYKLEIGKRFAIHNIEPFTAPLYTSRILSIGLEYSPWYNRRQCKYSSQEQQVS